ncbi:MAG: fibronectin type III domain-containing protein [Verrucomicrobia bacterium]|nr:fibronectin type III domain-containing protein [Verrucomicrobiota bacterium]
MKIQVKLELKGKTDAELERFSRDHIDKMAVNTAFATPTPGAAEFKSAHDAFAAALGDCDQAQKTAQEKTRIKDAKRDALESALTQRAHYIESLPGVTADQVLSAGFAVKAAGAASATPDKVVNLSLTTGDSGGEVDAQWNRVLGARSYEVQFSADPFAEATWHNGTSVTRSKTSLHSLTTGTKTWVRARAIAAGGPGAWSDPAQITVP